MSETVCTAERRFGAFVADDYIAARRTVSGIVIAPFDPQKAKGTGYNLAPSVLVYSVNKKRLVQVRENEKEVLSGLIPMIRS